MKKLAILGGPKTVEGLPLMANFIGEEEKKLVMEVLDSGELSGFTAIPGKYFYGGPKVRQLEAEWRQFTGAKHAIAVNSATSGLHAAVVACGVGPGDEVILPPLTMAASAEAILAVNGVPVFCDTLQDSLLIDPEDMKKKYTERTKAIMVVHLLGHPCDMDPIMAFAKEKGLLVIEDNAQAPYALYKGKQTGILGDLGVFSLNCHKTIQSGEGGVITTNNDDLAIKCQLFRNHGDKVAKDIGYAHFYHVGLNNRMTELEAAVSIAQLRKLEDLTMPRIANAKVLDEGLKHICGIEPPSVAEDCRHVYYLYHMRYEEEVVKIPLDLFAKALQAEGFPIWSRYGAPIFTYPIYKDLSAYGNTGCPFKCPLYKGKADYSAGICPTAEKADQTSLWTNIIGAQYTEQHMHMLLDAMQLVIANRDELLANAAKKDFLNIEFIDHP